MWQLGLIHFFPGERLPEFTHGGRWRVRSDYRDESHGKTQEIHWTFEHVDGQVR